MSPAIFRYGKKFSNDRHKELLNSKTPIAACWKNDEAEKEWSLFIKEAIEKKIKKLQEESFSKFNQNWLAIYNNSPVSFLYKEYLIPYIKTLFPVESPFCFDLIFIESSCKEDSSVSESKIFVLSEYDQKYLSVNDVWKRT